MIRPYLINIKRIETAVIKVENNLDVCTIMPKLAEIQKFIIWVFGSITVFGCISTLIAYLIYDDKPTVDCKPNDTQCEQRNQNITATQRDNEILKIISPVAVAVGIVMIVIIRCWQQSAAENANEARREGGEANTAYQGTECKNSM